MQKKRKQGYILLHIKKTRIILLLKNADISYSFAPEFKEATRFSPTNALFLGEERVVGFKGTGAWF